MIGFRSVYKAELTYRLLDAAGHVLLAWLLPGPWWAQWLPDVFLPLIWAHGVLTDNFLPRSNVLLKFHRVLHSGVMLAPLLYGVWFGTNAFRRGLALQWAAHIVLDLFTHKERH